MASPYYLRLTLDRATANAGELVNARIEFTNTGTTNLWIPRQREISFGFETLIAGSGRMDLTSSACDGLEFIRLSPGQKISYDKAVSAPEESGAWEIYIMGEGKVRAPLLIR